MKEPYPVTSDGKWPGTCVHCGEKVLTPEAYAFKAPVLLGWRKEDNDRQGNS